MQVKEHNHSQAQQAKRTRAFRYAQPMFFSEAHPMSDPSGTQRRVCSLWEGTGRSTESTVFPTDESMYDARTRAPSSLFAAGARIAGASH